MKHYFAFTLVLFSLIGMISCHRTATTSSGSSSSSSGEDIGSADGSFTSSWNTETSSGSSRIKIESSLTKTELEMEIRGLLSQLSFEVDRQADSYLRTKAKDIEGPGYMRLTIDYITGGVIVSGEQGVDFYGNGINWKPITKGSHPWGTPAWEQMNVFARAISHTRIMYQ